MAVNEKRFDGRVAIVTGAGGGLGREYALLLAARGCKVVVNDLGTSRSGEGADIGMAQAVVEEIRAAGGQALANGDSVATADGCAGIMQTALDAWGKCDILIHNATINRRGPFRDLLFEDFSAVLDVHLSGAFHLAKQTFPRMCDAGYGRIVFVASIAGLYGEKDVAAYCTAKGAINGLANALALEGLGHGVGVNCIVPCAKTRLVEGRDVDGFPPWGPELVAPAVAWLAHEDCQLTGKLLVSLAGRMAEAFVTETDGVYQPQWQIEDVADRYREISSRDSTRSFSPVPNGFYEHLGFSFDMARANGAEG